jgi:uncharacterized membrane protein YeaQ/YmgE (transglycosylase-associated protein family)
MLNFVMAVVIAAVIGGIGGFVLRGRNPMAVWLTPLLALVGTLAASVAAMIFGDAGYGWKEATLQVVLAIGAVVVVSLLKKTSPQAA